MIVDMDLSVRAKNCLLRGGYYTLEDIINSSIYSLMRVRNLGRKSLEEIKEIVKEYCYEIPEVSL